LQAGFPVCFPPRFLGTPGRMSFSLLLAKISLRPLW
jgi:hypothetical protein